MSVTLKDFQPINHWKLDLDGKIYPCGEGGKKVPQFIIDQTTGRRYLNESRKVVGIKCFLLTLATPCVHPVASIANVAYRILKLISFSHFWINKGGEAKYNFKARLADAGIDLLRIVATPISIIGLELAAFYGCFRPYDGRKLYASIERATYGNFIIAPCFQPEPQSHALGGNINRRNVF
jgi:hypothetical protein